MKTRNVVLLSFAACAFAAGAIATTTFKQVKAVEKTEASQAGKVVYLEPNSDWKSESARFALYWFKNDESEKGWLDMTAFGAHGSIEANRYYYVTVPSSAETIIFCRMNGSESENKWDGGVKWNQTDNLALDGTDKNVYKITGWDKSGAWEDYSINAEGYIRNLTFYAGSPDDSAPNVHAWNANGSSLRTNTGVWPGMAMSDPEPIIFNNRRLYEITLQYKVYKSDDSDIGDIYMVINNGGDSNKSPNITTIDNGHYYYPDGGDRWSAYSHSAALGEAASAAMAISKASLCSTPATETADTVKGLLTTYESNLSSATWDGYTYEEVYNWVDKYSSTPGASSKAALYTVSQENNAALVTAVASATILASAGGLMFFRKRKIGN